MEKNPVMTREMVELLEQSEDANVPVGHVITIQLPKEFLIRMALFCQHNPTQYPQ
jgi:hypothetical protein